MLINNFNHLVTLTSNFAPLQLSIALPHNAHVLESLYLATKNNLVTPFISGNRRLIEDIAVQHDIDCSLFNIFDLPEERCIPHAIELVQNGTCNLLMKGDHSTASIMSLVLKKSNQLTTSKVLSHIYVLEVPTYHKLLMITDGALNIAPTLQAQVRILENAIDFANILGINTPKVALLSAVEVPTIKMPSTITALELAQNLDLQRRCIIEGPMAFDGAISREAASVKNMQSEVAGDIDIAFAPFIEINNVLSKALIYLARARAAGLIVGAKVPIILTSRSDSAESKFLSIALASLYVNGNRNL